jgi:hypothetical protein
MKSSVADLETGGELEADEVKIGALKVVGVR